MVLEQMLEFAPRVQKNINKTIDVYAKGTVALYSGQIGGSGQSGGFGLQNAQPFQYGYNLGGGCEVHMHGPDRTTLTYGTVKENGIVTRSFNGYESAMVDPILKNNFRMFP